MKKITEFALDVFRAIDRHKEANDGVSPTVRELMATLGYRSVAPVQHHLENLRMAGCIDWDEGQSRTIRRLKSLHEVEGITVKCANPVALAQAAGRGVERGRRTS